MGLIKELSKYELKKIWKISKEIKMCEAEAEMHEVHIYFIKCRKMRRKKVKKILSCCYKMFNIKLKYTIILSSVIARKIITRKRATANGYIFFKSNWKH